MNEKIACEMIQDLLPLYVDHLTHEVTSREIERHLKQCQTCRESYERMKIGLEKEEEQRQTGVKEEVDYLKSLKKRNVKHVITGICTAVFMILAVAGAKIFIIGSPSDSYFITYLNVDEDQIYVGGSFFGSGSVYAGHKLVMQPDGSQKLVVYTCLASAWNRNGVFNLILDREDIKGQVEINGDTVTKEGLIISKLANELYKAKNPYIGDASADGRLTQVLGVAQHMGDFTNELQTTSEPYGWTLKYEDSVRNSTVFEARMKDYACVFLALTDNLGEVAWSYTVETEAGPVERQTALTAREATEYLGQPVKGFGESAQKVQELLELLNLP